MIKPVNILYVSACKGIGGAANVFLILLENQDIHTFRPIVATSNPADITFVKRVSKICPIYKFRMHKWNRSELTGLLDKILQYPVWLKRAALSSNTVIQLVRLIRKYNIHIIHTNTAMMIEGALAARLSGVPHVWHIHERLSEKGHFSFFCGLEKAVQLITFLSDKIITVSDFLREPFVQYGNPNQTVTIYNGIDLHRFDSIASRHSSLRRDFDIPTNVPLVCTIGYVSPVKKLETYIEAAAMVHSILPEVRFLIVGRINVGYPKYYSRLLNMIESSGLHQSIIFTDFRTDIPALLKEIDLLVHTSPVEGLPTVVLEAMATSKPVVGVQAGGVKEIVLDGYTGILVPPENPEELAHAEVKVLMDPILAKTMGEACRKRVEETFEASVYTRNVEKVFLEVLGKF